MTKWQLFNMLGLPCGAMSVVIDSNNQSYIGIVKSVEREDSSGQYFNVSMRIRHGDRVREIKVFVRTID